LSPVIQVKYAFHQTSLQGRRQAIGGKIRCKWVVSYSVTSSPRKAVQIKSNPVLRDTLIRTSQQQSRSKENVKMKARKTTQEKKHTQVGKEEVETERMDEKADS
jgi:hypothetical protein